MRTYLIGCDLSRARGVPDYPDLIAAIMRIAGGNYWHRLDATWILKSDRRALDICNELVSLIDDDDDLLVIEVTREAAWAESSRHVRMQPPAYVNRETSQSDWSEADT